MEEVRSLLKLSYFTIQVNSCKYSLRFTERSLSYPFHFNSWPRQIMLRDTLGHMFLQELVRTETDCTQSVGNAVLDNSQPGLSYCRPLWITEYFKGYKYSRPNNLCLVFNFDEYYFVFLRKSLAILKTIVLSITLDVGKYRTVRRLSLQYYRAIYDHTRMRLHPLVDILSPSTGKSSRLGRGEQIKHWTFSRQRFEFPVQMSAVTWKPM